jgi:dihydroorotate dehydrogenase
LWKLFGGHFSVEDRRLQVTLGPLTLRNPIGIAAGFDKNCEMARALERMGFGYLTLGTVTLEPRQGNPKPRIWRQPGRSLLNSMGLPNAGAQEIITNLSSQRTGANWTSPIVLSVSGLALKEFVECFRLTEPLVDAIELNISSPNTAGVRIFQDPSTFAKLLDEVQKVNISRRPVWVKIPPYFSEPERENVLDLVALCMRKSVNGITAVNTKRVPEPRASIGTAGLSGPPLFQDMIRIVSEIYTQTEGKFPINACGGISSAANLWRAMESGASTVQLYTAFIYQGPGLVSALNRKILQMLKDSEFACIADVTGSGLR